jgi:signal transduction protein with GAF and PtsI domain
MNVKLSQRQEDRIEALAKAQGRGVSDVLQEVVEKGLERIQDNGTKTPETWKPRLLKALDEMQALPIESPADGFSGADHDEVLYPRQS